MNADDEMNYELDDDFIEQLKQQNHVDSEALTTTSDFEADKKQAELKISKYREETKKKKHELAVINKWKAALKKNDMDQMKDEVGEAIGNLYNQAMRIFEEVDKQGVMLNKITKMRDGSEVHEPIANPLLPVVQKIIKDLDITLSQFLLTPKSQKETPAVQVNIGISANEVQARFMKRYSKELPRNEDE